jgi:methionine-rich copper-binding protein CopC
MRAAPERIIALAAVTVLALVAATGSASAQVQIESSSPTAGAIVDVAPNRVEVVFTGPILSVRGAYGIDVHDASRQIVTSGPAEVDTSDATRLRVPLRPDLPPGRYAVVWRAVSETDSAPAQGAFSFYVAVEPTEAERDADRTLEREGGLPIDSGEQEAADPGGGDGVPVGVFVLGAAILVVAATLALRLYLRRARP